jgi:hypothetical protein
VQLLDRFEQRIDQLVNGAFARAFKAEVQPVEVAAALQRELDDQAITLAGPHAIVPNVFVIDLSTHDFERLMAFEVPLRTELADVVREYTTERQFRMLGVPLVRFTEDPALSTGLFRISTDVREDAAVEAQRKGPHLIVNGFIHPLTRHTTRIGRGTDVDIRIDDAGVSRHHAEIVLTMPITLRDLGSTNGTWIDKQRVTEVTLEHDTAITIGPAVIEFRAR